VCTPMSSKRKGEVGKGGGRKARLTAQFLEGPQKYVGGTKDVGTDHEMGDYLILLLQKVVQSRGRIGVPHGTIVDTETDHAIWCVPDVSGVSTPELSGANRLLSCIDICWVDGGYAAIRSSGGRYLGD